jgi:ParB family chromosome partitioning protein
MAKARGLGRGLNALIPSSSNMAAANNANNYDADEVASENNFVPTEATNDSVATSSDAGNLDFRKNESSSEPRKVGLSWVEISTIAPNPYQPRKHIDPEILNELADSIKELGIIQPPVVSYNPDFDPDALKQAQYTEDSSTETLDADGKNRRARYLLIAGERRWQASKLAGLTTIPVVIKESTPLQMLEMALVENIQRADLNPLEEAQAYRQLVSEFKLTQQDVARRVGKSRAAVANALRLLDMPKAIYACLNDATITEGHARALLMVESPRYQTQLLQEILKDDLSVRQTEEKARRYNALASTQTVLAELEAEAKAQRQIRVAERQTRELEDHLRRILDTKVDLIRSKKGGKITIQFFSDEELENVFRKIVGDYEI